MAVIAHRYALAGSPAAAARPASASVDKVALINGAGQAEVGYYASSARSGGKLHSYIIQPFIHISRVYRSAYFGRHARAQEQRLLLKYNSCRLATSIRNKWRARCEGVARRGASFSNLPPKGIVQGKEQKAITRELKATPRGL